MPTVVTVPSPLRAEVQTPPALAVMTSGLLALPAELRNRIYDCVATIDLETFADKMTKPGLLKASSQLRTEYSDVFFGSDLLRLDAYSGISNTWQQVQNKRAKRTIFEGCIFTDLLEFWSVGSARRYCQRLYSDWQGNVQTGIMTINTGAGIRRWQWSLAQVE